MRSLLIFGAIALAALCGPALGTEAPKVKLNTTADHSKFKELH